MNRDRPKIEIKSTIKSKEDLDVFFEALVLALGERKILNILEKASKISKMREIRNRKKIKN